jgi:hypothetical protein
MYAEKLECEKRGTRAGTFHAAEQLKRRYGLEYPLNDFLRWIRDGRATEIPSIVPGRRIFDVNAPGNSLHPEQIVRVVVGISQAGEMFVVTFLPLRFRREILAEQEEAHRKSEPNFLDARKDRKRNHFKEFRRVNADDENEIEFRGATMTEIFGSTPNQGEENRAFGILGENRSRGWKEVPADAPEWVKNRITEVRQAILDGREVPTGAIFTAEQRAEMADWKTAAIRESGLGAFAEV